jgi:putative membrane protein
MRRFPSHSRFICRSPLVALAAALACGRPPVPSAPAPTANVSRFRRVPDNSTAAILLMANNVDLAYARIAATRARDREVKALARRMTADHTALNATLRGLVSELDLTPREDDISRTLRDESTGRRDSLRALSGRRFDSAYVANEIRYHQELLVAIDRVFTPSVHRPALRDYVAAMRPTITAHLEHAQQVQSTLAARK